MIANDKFRIRSNKSLAPIGYSLSLDNLRHVLSLHLSNRENNSYFRIQMSTEEARILAHDLLALTEGKP